VILIIIALASIFAYAVSTLGIVDPLAQAVSASGVGSLGALTMVMIVLLFVGMVLDGVSIFLIFVPLLAPLMKSFDWDPVWFGVLMTFMVAIGQFTPPVAVNLMVSCRMARVRIESTIPWVMWFVFTMMLVLALLVAVPETSLWLPRALGY
jgi:TRAP-type C4-dicarboxylate transport system permease large subunit